MISQSNIVIADSGFAEGSFPDFYAAARAAIEQPVIPWESIDVVAISQSPQSLSPGDGFGWRYPEEIWLFSTNPISAIVNVQRALLTEKDYSFGLALVLHGGSVGAVVFKRANYRDPTQWIPEGIIASALDSGKRVDIIQGVIAKAKQELTIRQEPLIILRNIQTFSGEDGDARTLSKFFEALKSSREGPDKHLIMLAWKNEYRQSAILIQG